MDADRSRATAFWAVNGPVVWSGYEAASGCSVSKGLSLHCAARYVARSRSHAAVNASRQGQLSLRWIQTRLAEHLIRAPTFRNRKRIVPHCARAMSVPVKASRRNASKSA